MRKVVIVLFLVAVMIFMTAIGATARPGHGQARGHGPRWHGHGHGPRWPLVPFVPCLVSWPHRDSPPRDYSVRYDPAVPARGCWIWVESYRIPGHWNRHGHWVNELRVGEWKRCPP